MAAPNIRIVNTIFGKTNVAVLNTTLSNVLVNASTSGNVIKVNDITISNFTGSAIYANLTFGRGSSLYFIAGTLTLPAYSTVAAIGKDTTIYLEEGDYLQANTSSATGSHLIVSYESIN
jgi:hypothetical protein